MYRWPQSTIVSMKRIYAAILLVSFLAGIFQPVIPMAQFYLQNGDLAGLIADGSDSHRQNGTDHFCSHDIITLPDDWQPEKQGALIDTGFYPIPVKPDYSPGRAILPIVFQGYQAANAELTDRFIKRYTPPPRPASLSVTLAKLA